MKINVEIIQQALVHNPHKIESLNEKELVKKMMVRRRLSRSSKILVYLADACEFTQGTMVYGSAYGEILDTTSILEAIKDEENVSPSAFQNSVYNTAASYHSIIHQNSAEILTLSCGDETSYRVMQQGALTLLKEDEVFVSCVEAVDFEGIKSLNNCSIELEYGLAFRLKKTEKKANVLMCNKSQQGVPNSLLWMKNLYDLCQMQENPVIEIEL
jgi:hypothetical protein